MRAAPSERLSVSHVPLSLCPMPPCPGESHQLQILHLSFLPPPASSPFPVLSHFHLLTWDKCPERLACILHSNHREADCGHTALYTEEGH